MKTPGKIGRVRALRQLYSTLTTLLFHRARTLPIFQGFSIYFSDCICVCVCARARTYILFASRSVACVFGIHTITQSQGFYLAQKKRGRKKTSLRFSKGTRTRGEKTNLMYTACVFLEKKRTKQTFRNNIYQERNSFRFVHSRGYWCLGVHFSVNFSARTKDLFFLRFRPKKKL